MESLCVPAKMLTKGEVCIQHDAPWTKIDSLLLESVNVKDVHFTCLERNGAVAMEQITLPGDTLMFRTPYRLSPHVDHFMREVAREVRRAAAHWVSQAKGKPTLAELLDHLKHKFGAEQTSFVIGCLKCSIALGALSVTPKAKGDPDNRASPPADQLLVGISDSLRQAENLSCYAAGFADELETLANRIELLIGHWPTVGTFREELLRKLLQKNLPERFHVATGFILNHENQLDILIYDRIDHAPVFREGDLVVVPLEAVRAVIEVKSTLDSRELRSALALLHDIRETLKKASTNRSGNDS